MTRAAVAAVAVVAVLGGVLALIAVAMRLVPDDPAVWHVDPLLAVRTGKPNDSSRPPVSRQPNQTGSRKPGPCRRPS